MWVTAENKSSVKFYESCGFVADGKTEIKDRGRAVVSMRMKATL